MTVQEWLTAASARLKRTGVEAARLEAEVLLGHAVKADRVWLHAHPNEDIPIAIADEFLRRRLHHEPLAYILGYREFYGRSFRVSPAVLIPRQDTEILVEEALKRCTSGAKIMDVGTGSGCVGLTIALERTDVRVECVDISLAALEVASSNAWLLGADVTFRESDLLEGVDAESVDIVVSNPPYVSMDDPLAPEVMDYEPGLALFAEEDGLAVIRRLAGQAFSSLKLGGWFLCEIGFGQGPEVEEILKDAGFSVSFAHDLALIPRVAIGHKPV